MTVAALVTAMRSNGTSEASKRPMIRCLTSTAGPKRCAMHGSNGCENRFPLVANHRPYVVKVWEARVPVQAEPGETPLPGTRRECLVRRQAPREEAGSQGRPARIAARGRGEEDATPCVAILRPTHPEPPPH